MHVKDIMTTKVIGVLPETSVTEVDKILRTNGFSGVPVIDAENKVLGLISQREMFATESRVHIPTYVHLLEETKFVVGSGKELPVVEQQVANLKAKDILTPETFLATPEMDTIKLIEILITKKQNPIPVVDAEKKILGIVSHSDLFKLLLPKDYVNYTAGKNSLRPIDRELAYVHKDLSSRFSYVSKARANIWVTVAITLMIVGFVMGIIFTADPNIF